MMNNELIKWFLEHKDDKPNNLYHSKTFKIMKEYLQVMGYWKNKGRGKPDISNMGKTSTTGGESTKYFDHLYGDTKSTYEE